MHVCLAFSGLSFDNFPLCVPPNYQGQHILLTLMFFLINLMLLCLTETVNKLDCVLCDAHLLLGQL